MNKLVLSFFLVLASLLPASAGDAASLTATLKQGGYVIVFRHTATDDSQKDVFPFRFDDMKAQRQLSDKGREAARAIGASLKQLSIPLGEIYTSKLNRAVETGKLIAGKDVSPRDELTDSGAGSASKMANPEGDNEKIGRAIRELANARPATAANVVLITHKTNIADAFGKQFADVAEGEALIFKTGGSGTPVLTARVKANEWNGAAN
jgi:broad specificity phosphatase PhoE